MKKIKNILMSALLSLFSLQGLYAEEGEKVVVIKPACLAETTTPNRAPVRVPITAYYDNFTSSIIVSFIYDIGTYYQTRNLVHINWGWGGIDDGYYLSTRFNTNEGPVLTRSVTTTTYGTSGYYQYQLQMNCGIRAN